MQSRGTCEEAQNWDFESSNKCACMLRGGMPFSGAPRLKNSDARKNWGYQSRGA